MTALPRLHVVTDDRVLARADFLDRAAEVLEAGADALALHLRGPHASGRTVYELAKELSPRAEAAGSLLAVNDRVDVALGLGLPAVQLGGRSLAVSEARRLLGPEVLIGRSVHDGDEVRDAAGADFLVYGHVYATPSHAGEEGRGIGGLAAAVEGAGAVPVMAIGGVDATRVPEVRAVGAYGVATLRGIWDAEEPVGAVRDYISALGG